MVKATDTTKNEVVRALTSPQVGLAAFGLIAFVLTLARTGNLSLFQHVDNKKTVHEEIRANTQTIIDDLTKMEPAKLAAEGNVDEAILEALKEIKAKPDDLSTLMCTGNILVAFGSKEEGYKYLEKSVLLAPESRYVRLNYARRLADGDDQHKKQAIEQYNILCKKYPALWTEPHLELANLCIRTSNPKLAAEQYKIILGFSPDDVEMQKRYGFALAASGNEKEGFEAFVKACSASKDKQGYAIMAKSLLSKNENSAKKAISEIRIEVATKSQQTAPRMAYIQLLLYLERAEEAKALAEGLVKMDGQNPESHILLAEVALDLDDKALALNEFRSAVKLLHPAKA